ncbi:MAG TPA: PilN domain-containing protein [Pirellulaceae bacterium]|nr:PilN domain-containing protein [Pirellulaceae bacterium]
MKTHLNLMPMQYRRGHLILRRLKQWSVLWLLAAGITMLLGWTQWSHYQAGAAKLVSLEMRYQPIAAMKRDVTGLREKIDELQRRESLALSLVDERSMLGLVGLLSQGRQACEGRISIGELTLNRLGESGSATSVLTLTGIAADDLAVARFTRALREANAFTGVDLKSTGNAFVGTLEARTYTLECTF